MRWKRGQRLKLVSESEASGSTREILDEVRRSLGVPAVPKLYQAYAAFPQFLEIHWQAFRPVLQSRQFFLLGSRLYAESYTRAHNYFDIDSFPPCNSTTKESTSPSLSEVLEYYQYLDPLLLLISAAQMQAFEGPVGQPTRNVKPAEHPEFASEPCLLRDGQANPVLQRCWNARRRATELAFVSDEHRALACWPEFYAKYWRALKELLESPVFADCQYRLGDSALSMAGELPLGVETSVTQLLDAGMTDEQVASVAHINQAFMQALTGLVLDITFARIGFDKETSGKNPPPRNPPTKLVGEKTGSPIRAA